MDATSYRPAIFESNPAVLAGWAVVVALTIALVGIVERQRLANELQTEAETLHRLASQRADQHDAHLTALSVLAAAGEADRPDMFLEVATTILRFYPRIEAIDLVPLAQPGSYVGTRRELSDQLAKTIRSAARGLDGHLILRPVVGADDHYLVVKRSPNTEAARFGLALEVDMKDLISSDSAFWQRPSVVRRLAFPSSANSGATTPAASLQFEKPLGSVSQPLIFRASMTPGLSDLFRPVVTLTATVLVSLLYFAGVMGFRQFARARRAERRALLSAQDARLAHASRVNALGEMASGMAHELTQPLTAVLSQAQAGRHLMERGDIDGLRAALDGVIAQTRRASAILERLRNWTRPQPTASGPVSVNSVAINVRLLLQAEADRGAIDLRLQLDPQTLPVRADVIEMEQVLFNLVRNAMDAVATAAVRQIQITTRAAGSVTIVEVSDSGPGIAPDVRSRLFVPFVSGKPGGTGLGLALCQRLVEKAGGEITLADRGDTTTFSIRLPVLADSAAKAAERPGLSILSTTIKGCGKH